MYNHFKTLLPVLALNLIVSGCATISRFDQYAYSQTTSIKVDAMNLMGKATESYNQHITDVTSVQTTISKMYEYERNRPKNSVSEKMWTVLKDSTGHLFGGFVKRWQNEGKLDEAFVKESQTIIAASFDQILQLESGKIKQSQINN